MLVRRRVSGHALILGRGIFSHLFLSLLFSLPLCILIPYFLFGIGYVNSGSISVVQVQLHSREGHKKRRDR